MTDQEKLEQRVANLETAFIGMISVMESYIPVGLRDSLNAIGQDLFHSNQNLGAKFDIEALQEGRK